MVPLLRKDLAEDWGKVLLGGMTKPAKTNVTNIPKLPAVVEATTVWKIAARDRNMDKEVK